MTNFEKYKDDEALQSVDFGVIEGKPVTCDRIYCSQCSFWNDYSGCRKSKMEWLKAEYEEPKINLPKDLPIDAKIEVSEDGEVWRKRHFARFENGEVLAWYGSGTSWSSNTTLKWRYARLPQEE